MNFPRSAWGTLPLRVPAWLYGVLVRRRMRRKLQSAARASIPVVSIGNLTVGGTGKTPLAAWVAEQFLQASYRPAIVSRGYGGRAGRGPLVVSRGEGPLVEAEVAGDEPYLLAASLPGVRVVVGSDRLAGVERAAELGSRVAILDDGFQHQQLARDLDVVLIDGSDPFGNGLLLPAGPLREPLASLARAGLVVVTRSSGSIPETIRDAVSRHAPQAALMAADHRCVGLFNDDGRAVATPERILAFCGIGNPGRFRRDLESTGAALVHFMPYRDHHNFTMPELSNISRLAKNERARIVTTEKDRARIGSTPHSAELLTMRIAFEPADAAALRRALLGALPAGER